MPSTRRRCQYLASALWFSTSLLVGRAALADQVLTFTGEVTAGSPNHVSVEFQLEPTTQEIQVDHDDLDPDDILDWGLSSPAGFRGWGGGNSEPAVVNAQAASRSYLAGALEQGTWRVDIGKAKISGPTANYAITVTLRDVPTLAAQTERSSYEPAPALEQASRWYAGDFHVHSNESGDATATFQEIATLARNRGLDFVELSDHNTVSQLDYINSAQANLTDLLLLPGVEFTTYAGHANGIGATQFVDHKFDPSGPAIARASDAFRAQGALFAINHPAFELGDACIGCGWNQELAADKIDAIEIATAGSASLFYDNTVKLWEDLAGRGARLAAIGGSDDHRAGVDPGAFGTPIGSPTTMVFADELSAAGLIAGIRQGRTVVKLRGPDDPMVLLETFGTGDASRNGVRAKISAGAGKQARFVVDGTAMDFVEVDSDDFLLQVDTVGEPGEEHRYRVEVYEGTTPATATSHLWLITEQAGASDVRLSGGACSSSPSGESGATSTWPWLFLLLAPILRRKRLAQRDT